MEKFMSAVTEHLPVIIGLSLAIYWLTDKVVKTVRAAKEFVDHAIDQRVPDVIKHTLSNGGGEIIRKIVREENSSQSRLYKDDLDQRFTKHELQEDLRFRSLEEEVFKRRRGK